MQKNIRDGNFSSAIYYMSQNRHVNCHSSQLDVRYLKYWFLIGIIKVGRKCHQRSNRFGFRFSTAKMTIDKSEFKKYV